MAKHKAKHIAKAQEAIARNLRILWFIFCLLTLKGFVLGHVMKFLAHPLYKESYIGSQLTPLSLER
jgi:hypothetical protein